MDDVHRTLGTFYSYNALSILIVVPVLIQRLASDMNKSRRAFNYYSASTVDNG
jgi:hypothetical protein